MRNKISDLRNHMFAALERLNNEELSPEQLQLEVARSKGISDLGKVIVESAKTEILHAKMTNSATLNSNFIDENITNAEEPKKLQRPPAEYSNTGHLQIVKKHNSELH